MTLLKRLFGGRSADEEQARGEALLAEGDAGGAKLAFERALHKAKDAPAARRDELLKKMHEAQDAIAQTRLREAEAYLAANEVELAQVELQGALEVVVDENLRARAQRIVDTLERSDAVARAAPTDLSADEVLGAMAGSWEDAQAAEYAELGDPFEAALLALHDGKARTALEAMNDLLDQADEPRYLWYEVGRAHFELDEPSESELDDGADALRTFIECMDEHEGGDARLTAHLLLARLADGNDDVEEAVAELEAAAAALQHDPRPYKELGAYLRSKNRGAEAVEVLELALQGSEETPDWAFLTELGLAYEAAGNRPAAIETLEGVLQTLAAHRRLDFPPPTAVSLARLHEEENNLERAADLYRTLCDGSDRGNHATYHYEAGRLLRKLDLASESRRMLTRARALAKQLEDRVTSADHPDTQQAVLDRAREEISALSAKIESELAELGEE